VARTPYSYSCCWLPLRVARIRVSDTAVQLCIQYLWQFGSLAQRKTSCCNCKQTAAAGSRLQAACAQMGGGFEQLYAVRYRYGFMYCKAI
jgi:hypothetical protein